MPATWSYGGQAASFEAPRTWAATFTYQLLALGQAQAARRGLTREDAEDCAVEFALRMFQEGASALHQRLEQGYGAAWLHRCAQNAARNWRRAAVRLHKREQPWPEVGDSPGVQRAWDCPARQPGAATDLLREEFWERVRQAVEQLPAGSQELFVRHFLQNESIQDLAASSGRTPNAVRQALWALRGRLRAAVEAGGLSEAEAREYLAALTPHDVSRRAFRPADDPHPKE